MSRGGRGRAAHGELAERGRAGTHEGLLRVARREAEAAHEKVGLFTLTVERVAGFRWQQRHVVCVIVQRSK